MKTLSRPVYRVVATPSLAYFLLVTVVFMVCGCAGHNHGRAYLMKANNAQKVAPVLADDELNKDMYTPELYNAISIPADTDFQVKIDELHLGYLHRELVSNDTHKTDRHKYEGLGGKEIWVVATVCSLSPNDPLGLNEKRFAKAFSVKVDQESFSFVPHDDMESVIFQGRSTESYRLTLKVYEVDGYEFYKLLAQTAGKGIARELYNAAADVVSTTTNALFKEMLDTVAQRMEEPLAIERLLLTSNASIELLARVDFNRDSHLKWPDQPYRYAFLDNDKDGNFTRLGLTRDEYLESYIRHHEGVQSLPTEDEVRMAARNNMMETPQARTGLGLSYCKFEVEPQSEEERAKNATLGKAGFEQVLFQLKEERKNEEAQRQLETAKKLKNKLAKVKEETKPNGPVSDLKTIEEYVRSNFDGSVSPVIKVLAKIRQLREKPDHSDDLNDLLSEAERSYKDYAEVTIKQLFAYEANLAKQTQALQNEIRKTAATIASETGPEQQVSQLFPADLQTQITDPSKNADIASRILGLPVSPPSVAAQRSIEAQESLDNAKPTITEEVLSRPPEENTETVDGAAARRPEVPESKGGNNTALTEETVSVRTDNNEKTTDSLVPQGLEVRESLDMAKQPARTEGVHLLSPMKGETLIDLGRGAFGFEAGMAVDVDGAPNAYHPDDKGIDYLANAGMPYKEDGRLLTYKDKDWKKIWKAAYEKARKEGFRGDTKFKWWGIRTTGDQKIPIIQQESDSSPGYFVSMTTLTNPGNHDANSQAQYIDSVRIPYIALPWDILNGSTPIKLGDIVVVYRRSTGRSAYAIVADKGPAGKYGEGSVKLLEELGHHPYAGARAKNGIENNDVIYVVFSGTGDGYGKGADEIRTMAEKAFNEWGGMNMLKTEFTL